MTSSFVIQTSQPRVEPSFDPEDRSLSDATQSVFPLFTEDMFVVWNHIYIPLGYKYEVSFVIDDALDLVEAILTNMVGRHTIHWPSNTFASSWVVEWCPSRVSIEATWRSAPGGTESLLKESGPVEVPAEAFTAEWKRPFELVSGAIRSAGYSELQIPRLRALDSVWSRIHTYGRLYVNVLDS